MSSLRVCRWLFRGIYYAKYYGGEGGGDGPLGKMKNEDFGGGGMKKETDCIKKRGKKPCHRIVLAA